MIAREVTEATHGSFSVGAEYTPPDGESVEVEVVVDLGSDTIQVSSHGAASLDKRDMADFLASQVRPERNATLEITDERSSHHGKKWRIGPVESEDGHIVTAFLLEHHE